MVCRRFGRNGALTFLFASVVLVLGLLPACTTNVRTATYAFDLPDVALAGGHEVGRATPDSAQLSHVWNRSASEVRPTMVHGLLQLVAVPPSSAFRFVYDVRSVARVDVRSSGSVDSGSAQFTGMREGSASPPVEAQGTSTTSFGPSVATNKLTNGTQFETLYEAPITGTTRGAHRAAANRNLLGQLEADDAFRQSFDDMLGTDVVGHMQSGSGALKNPPGTTPREATAR